jgi:hypothetical protein
VDEQLEEGGLEGAELEGQQDAHWVMMGTCVGNMLDKIFWLGTQLSQRMSSLGSERQ